MIEEAHKADCDGSQPLPNRKRETFARLLFEGVEACAAYELAGYKRPRGNAQRMEREEEMQSRVNCLRQKLDAADLALRTVRRRQLRNQLKAIAEVDRVDMFEEIAFVKKIGRGRNAREITLRFNSSRWRRSRRSNVLLSRASKRTACGRPCQASFRPWPFARNSMASMRPARSR